MKINIKNIGEVNVSKGITLEDVARQYQDQYNYPILLAKYNNELTDLNRKVNMPCDIEFLDITSKRGYSTYQNTVAYLFITAVKEVFHRDTQVVIKHSIGKNYYIDIIDDEVKFDAEKLKKVKEVMLDKINSGVRIEKFLMPVSEAIKVCADTGMQDKVEILKYRRGSNVHMYKLDWFINYFYGQLVCDLRKVDQFELEVYEEGAIIVFPDKYDFKKLNSVVRAKKLLEVFEESDEWARILGIDTVGSLNNKIVAGEFGDVIRISEALQETKIAEIAKSIDDNKKKIILIAGPSSSGKTTFAHKLSVYLRAHKMVPHVISLDDYYLDRKNIPFDENGKQNFEVVESLEIEMINRDLDRLIEGEEVEIPSYNFSLGIKEYKGKKLKLNDEDVVIMEGIHGLNEIISSTVSKDDKYKIFISALTQLSIDNHNRIATTDSRLVRRIVRDSKYRGFEPRKTIGMWPEVLQGEIDNIFPYQGEADVVFNSSMVYEMSVLKPYIEAALFSIKREEDEYSEAKRLLKFLENFLCGDDEEIPNNSLIREFIGGSVFRD